MLLWCLVGWCVAAVALGLVLGPAIALGSRAPVPRTPVGGPSGTERDLTSACGRRFARIGADEWLRAADVEAMQALRHVPESVRE
ncbi:hypothetical protein [Jatrophihabitans fulvus]